MVRCLRLVGRLRRIVILVRMVRWVRRGLLLLGVFLVV